MYSIVYKTNLGVPSDSLLRRITVTITITIQCQKPKLKKMRRPEQNVDIIMTESDKYQEHTLCKKA